MRVVYKAEDGREFKTAEECQQYEDGPEMLKFKLCKYLSENRSINWYDPSSEEIVDALLQGYYITPKKREG